MYRCTECNTEFENLPDYCDCGNDTFEEFYEEEEYYEPEPRYERPAPPPKKRLTPEEREELAREEAEKKKSLIVAAIVLVLLCVELFVCPPHKKPKIEKVKEKVSQNQVKLPSVYSYWDNTVTSQFRATKDPLANLPLLNDRFRYISPVLREYLVNIGSEFNRKWDTSIIKGSGDCKVEFTINKEGNLNSKRIVATSHNESLDNSVLLLLSKLNSFDIPPDDYKGERVYIQFKVDADKSSHVSYPMK